MLTPKQKAFLKGKANTIKNRFLIGKNGVDESFIGSIDNALEAHELIKVGLLPTAEESAKEAAEKIARATKADVVQVIGKVAVLYRPSKKNKRIELP